MDITEKQRELVVALCQKIGTTADLITKGCDTLLREANGSLNEEQIADTDAIRRASKDLLAIIDEINQLISSNTFPLARQEEFPYFMSRLANELKSPLSLIIGFSQCSLKGITGSLTDRQKETMKHIDELGQMLYSIIEESLTQTRGTPKEL